MSLNNPTDIMQTVAFEDNSLFVMRRILGHAGTAITIASMTGITLKVYDSAGEQVGATQTLTVSAVVFDTPQTTALDPRWTIADAGYNFAYTVPGASFPSPEEMYDLEFNFDPVSGDDFNFVAQHQTKPLRSK